MAHLLQIVTECELFRAADYIADLLGVEHPARPSRGPAAVVFIPPKDDEDGTQNAVNREPNTNESVPRNVTNTIEMQNRNNENGNDKGYEAVNKILLPSHSQNSSSVSSSHNIPIRSGSDVPHTNMTTLSSHSQIPEALNPSNLNNSINNQSNSSRRTATNSINVVLTHSNNQVPSIPIQNQPILIPNLDSLMHDSRPISKNYQPRFSALLLDSNSNQQETKSDHYSPDSSSNASEIISNQSDNMMMPDFDRLNLNSSSSIPSLPQPQLQLKSFQMPMSADDFTPHFSDLLSPQSVSPNFQQKNLKSFTFQEIKSATDNFNNNPFNSADYFDGRKLGSGGFSDVYLAVNLEPMIQYSAVKKLKKGKMAKFKEKFDLEIQTLSQLTHLNLINLLGYSQDSSEYCLVYEFIRGGNLEEKLTKSRLQLEILTWRQRVEIMIGCADGIAYLHGENIIHRDIKSSNILLTHDTNIPKICDFGLIRELDSMLTTQPMGTLGYAAPEIFHGQTTAAADIYSFGAVLLEIVTGLKFVDNQRANSSLILYFNELLRSENFTYDMIIDRRAGDWGQIATSPEVSAGFSLLDLSRNCLEYDRYKRPTSAHDISLILKDCLNKFS